MYHDTVTPGHTVRWHSMLRFTVTLVLRVTLFQSPWCTTVELTLKIYFCNLEPILAVKHSTVLAFLGGKPLWVGKAMFKLHCYDSGTILIRTGTVTNLGDPQMRQF